MLITGLGPVGLAVGALCRKLGAQKIFGIDIYRGGKAGASAGAPHLRRGTTRQEVKRQTKGHGVERAIDCSGDDTARTTAIRATGKWGRIVFLGEGGNVYFHPSPDLIHDQKALYGSWVTSTWRMEELVENLVRWNLHPAELITQRFALEKAEAAYALMAAGTCGKVAVCFDEELI